MDVCIILGSKSDMPVCDKCTSVLNEFGIDHEVHVASAHRAPRYLEEVVSSAVGDRCRIFIGIAGLSAALPGVIASMTSLPVIGVPVGGKVPLDSLLSVVQMPPGIPVAAVGVEVHVSEGVGIAAALETNAVGSDTVTKDHVGGRAVSRYRQCS